MQEKEKKSMTRSILTPTNDSGYIITKNTDSKPVLNKDKLPIVFDTIKAGKTYLKKRYKNEWTDYCFRIARYQLEPGIEIVVA